MNYLQKELYQLVKQDDSILEFLQNASLDGLWYWDLENPENEWMNERFWKILGYNPKRMPHKASAWQNIINQDDLNVAIENFQKHCEDPNHPYDQVVRYQHKDGSTVWVRCRGLAIRDNQGNPKRMLGAHNDITQLKQKEILLEESNRLAKIGSWEYDLSSKKFAWNNITREIFEVEKNYRPGGINDVIPFFNIKSHRGGFRKLLNLALNNESNIHQELEAKTKNGNDIWLSVKARTKFNNGKCVQLYGSFQDITEQKKSQEAKQIIATLESKSKEMEQFAYITSHDLREPLLTIKNYIGLLVDEYSHQLDEEAEHFTKAIAGAANRMDELISGLLDYSRLSQIKQLQKVDTAKVLETVKQDLNAMITSSKAVITSENLPALSAYPLELKLLFQNLIHNGIKFRKNGKVPKIHIKAKKNRGGWEFSFADNGIGIPKKDLENVFVIFRKLQSKKKYAGTGIGLALVKKIVEIHKGTTWVESGGENRGSTFYITILTDAL